VPLDPSGPHPQGTHSVGPRWHIRQLAAGVALPSHPMAGNQQQTSSGLLCDHGWERWRCVHVRQAVVLHTMHRMWMPAHACGTFVMMMMMITFNG
jgi:hypothetical protein